MPSHLDVVIWIGTALAATFTVAGTRLQYLHNRRLYINDYLICLALIFQLTLSILYQIMSPPMYSLEAAMHDLEPVTASNILRFDYYLRLQFVATYVFWSALWSVKLTLLTFFWRMFESVRSHSRPFWFCMQADLEPFQISSPSSVYGATLAFYFSSISDIITDFLIMLTPFPLLSKLQINSRPKKILVIIFLLPLIVISLAILRLVDTNAEGTTVDPIRLAFFSTVEVSCSIIAACLPSMRLFFVPQSATSSPSLPSYSRRSEAPFESLPHEDLHPLQHFEKSRGPQASTGSVESILPPEDIYVRRDFLMCHAQQV
ncbi:hypothetical protein IMSHALPRED_010355 [Imshaugia aleurites]|uniref:Rhodopsin domain-containing protein n=1 Tax=Imshaugia aleurites TaxID=172621 RepID=A0A8H3IZQ5_9LECA|nr:hypothetical protein IMSHALPRED_010355 [Imshaugia aleurites]